MADVSITAQNVLNIAGNRAAYAKHLEAISKLEDSEAFEPSAPELGRCVFTLVEKPAPPLPEPDMIAIGDRLYLYEDVPCDITGK